MIRTRRGHFGGNLIYTSSCNLPRKNAFLTFNHDIGQPLLTAIDKMHLMVVVFTIGEKVSLKSTRSLWILPLTTSLAFILSRLPSDLCFTLNTLEVVELLLSLVSLQGFKFTCHILLQPRVHSNLCISKWFSHSRSRIKNLLINWRKC